MSEEELKEERPAEYERLLETGNLESPSCRGPGCIGSEIYRARSALAVLG